MGWRSLGHRSMSSSMNLGTSERAAHSADKSFTCCSEGTCHQNYWLFSGLYFIGQEEPEETFGKRFTTTGCFRKLLLTFGNSFTTESDPLVGIKDRPFPHKTYHQPLFQEREMRCTFDSTHTTIDHVNCHGTEILVSMLTTKFLDLFLFRRNHLRKRILQ